MNYVLNKCLLQLFDARCSLKSSLDNFTVCGSSYLFACSLVNLSNNVYMYMILELSTIDHTNLYSVIHVYASWYAYILYIYNHYAQF